MNFQMLQ